MGLNKVIAVVSLALGASVLSLACAAQTDNTEDTASATEQDLTAAQTSCSANSDCAAISKGGCCPNGWNVAVNKSHVASYEKSHECKSPPTACPLAMIDDTRVAKCSSKGKCEMVAP